MKRPLIVVSGLRPLEVDAVRARLLSWRRPCYLEATSRLRGEASLDAFTIWGGEKSISRLDFDGVIRLGSVPTLRFWRDLEKRDVPVVAYSNLPFSGLARVSELHALDKMPAGEFEPWSEVERAADRELAEVKMRLMGEFPQSEPSWIHWLSTQIPSAARVLLGNSLPIREWDFAAHPGSARDIFASRGTNGIDGLVSTFAGVADAELSNWAVIGDLSALYDQAGLWALRQRPIYDFNLVIINNGGGQIFKRIFNDPMFLNAHDLNFQPWAKMWGLKYQRLQNDGHLPSIGEPRVVEIVPSNEHTHYFWNAWDKL